MGTWGLNPWDSDEAADWYSDFMESCGVREKWLAGIQADIIDEADIVRAAVGLFVMLGRVYIWPISHYEEDLNLAIAKCEALLKVDEYVEVPEFIGQIGSELEELKLRRVPPASSESGTAAAYLAPRKWWKFWD